MHDDHRRAEDDLNALERRLTSWRPADDGCDTAAMLFAAGRASARPTARRFVWPAVAAALALVAAGLGVVAAVQRRECDALRAELVTKPLPEIPHPPSPSPPLASRHPSSYLALSARARTQDVDSLVAYQPPPGDGTAGPAAPVLRAWGNGPLVEP